MKTDGGPAYPSGEVEDNFNENKHAMFTGMSLRDWFAGQALAGYVSRPPDATDYPTIPDVAEDAYRYADAMLAEREKS